ncbi:MAG: histidinol-phosphatase, partial [Paludibacteraceae bacterium]|nr:histidinol-phosphatase [Paludibacteraceae bacterium]
MKRALFIDRDGTLIVEPPVTEQVNSLDELEFLPGVIRNLYFLRKKTDFEFVIVSNQDGLGTPAYPQEVFDTVQGKMLEVFKGEGIEFDDVLIDKSFKSDNLPTRKPGTGLLTKYMSGEYDLANSYVIG